MGAEDKGSTLEELARRVEALEQETRELREALGSSASHREFERPQRQSQATQPKEVTVRGLLLSPRDEQAYSRPLTGVLPTYVVGLLLTCAVAAYGPYVALNITGGEALGWLGLGIIASLFFGIYAGIRDGRRFVFARFQYVGLITAIVTAMALFLTSLWIVSYLWRPPPEGGALRWVIEDTLFPTGAVFVTTWLLFVSGALLGTALQVWTSEREQVGRDGSIQGSSEGSSASTSGVKTQVWLGFAGTVLAALIALIGNVIGG